MNESNVIAGVDAGSNENSKIARSHLDRLAVVYLRQSSANQVEHNSESTRRQYDLVHRAYALGWPKERVLVIDADLGRSGDGSAIREGFAQLTADVALSRVGLVLGLEVSRLARNNADWHRLIDLAGLTDTLIADADGLYHPSLFNDRLLLGLKGAMSEAELHVLRARLNGGILNKARRGELRRGLPIGYVWGEAPGEVCFHPDESVVRAIHTVFDCFAKMGSARRVWKWFLDEGLHFPHRIDEGGGVKWKEPQYSVIYGVLSSPVYAGAYAYGKTRSHVELDEHGGRHKRVRRVSDPKQWSVFLPDHHQGFIDWQTYEANRKRMTQNVNTGFGHGMSDQSGAVREGRGLLQGLILCGHCGRRLRVQYQGRKSVPRYHCCGMVTMQGQSSSCLSIGGQQIDNLIAEVFLEAMEPARISATLGAAERIEADREALLAQWRHSVERAIFNTARAERRYQAVDPDNRLVARSLEQQWEICLKELETARAELAQREQQQPHVLNADERENLMSLGPDLKAIWHAKSTKRRDQKELLRTLIDDVTVTVNRESKRALLVLRWKGGQITRIQHELPRTHKKKVQTDESTINLVRRLAKYYPDKKIASILNQQGRQPARADRFDVNRVQALRRRHKIPCRTEIVRRSADVNSIEEACSLQQAADVLGVAQTTLLRHIQDGLIEANQVTPTAPWHIRLTSELKARFQPEKPDGYVPMLTAMNRLGHDRPTMVSKIKSGELKAAFVTGKQKKGIYIKLMNTKGDLFQDQGVPMEAI